MGKGVIEPEVRHHITKIRPAKLLFQLGKIRQDFCSGGDKIQTRIGPLQIVQQKLRMENDAVPGTLAFRQQTAEPVAPGIVQVLRPEQRIAEGQPGGDSILPQQSQHIVWVLGSGSYPASAPNVVRRSTIDGADVTPIVKILPVLTEQRQKSGI